MVWLYVTYRNWFQCFLNHQQFIYASISKHNDWWMQFVVAWLSESFPEVCPNSATPFCFCTQEIMSLKRRGNSQATSCFREFVKWWVDDMMIWIVTYSSAPKNIVATERQDIRCPNCFLRGSILRNDESLQSQLQCSNNSSENNWFGVLLQHIRCLTRAHEPVYSRISCLRNSLSEIAIPLKRSWILIATTRLNKPVWDFDR